MSAFGTKKRGGDVALQMTFPEVKASATALMDPHPYGFVEGETFQRADLPVAHDLQQRYHEEKRQYANRNAMNWVHNNGRTRWLMNHNTFGYTQPHPVLSQRVFANPSNGNTSDIYPARRTMGAGNSQTGDAPIKCSATGLQGGILRTHQGQDYYKKLMSARIDQLNAIASAVPQSTEGGLPNAGYPEVRSDDTEVVSDKVILELKSLMEQILTEYETNANQADLSTPLQASLFKTMVDAVRLLARVAVIFTQYDFEDLFRYLDTLVRLAQSMVGARQQGGEVVQRSELRNLKLLMGMLNYCVGMAKVINRPLEEKKIISASLLKETGLTKLAPDEGSLPGAGDEAKYRRRWLADNTATKASFELREMREFARMLNIRIKVANGYVSRASLVQQINAKVEPEEDEEEEEEEEEEEGEEEEEEAPPAPPAPAPPAPPGPPAPPAGRGRYMVGKMKGRGELKPDDFSDKAKFDIDTRVRFGDRQGAYLGEQIGDQVPVLPVPVPVEPDGTYTYPGSGYTRPVFPKIPIKRKPSNLMKVLSGPAPPVFQDSKAPPQLGIFASQRMTMPKAVAPLRTPFGFTGGKKGPFGLTKQTLPTTHEGFVQLAEMLRKNGHNIRVNSGAQLKNIRANFIRRLGL